MTKLDWLRAQMDAYLTDAKAQTDKREFDRLILLAARCQKQILELEYGRPDRNRLH